MNPSNLEKRVREAAKLEGRTEGAEDVRELVSRVASLFEQELARAMANPGELDAELALQVLSVHRRFAALLAEAVDGLVDTHRREHLDAINRFVAESRGERTYQPTDRRKHQ